MKIKDYYYGMLTEAYELRNFSEHGGKVNERAKTKMVFTFPLLVIRFRWQLFDYMKKKPQYSLIEIFSAIKQDYHKKIS